MNYQILSINIYIRFYINIHSYIYRGGVYAIGEIDGVRILNSDVCDFIQKVPPSSVSIFKPGSTAPAAILYDAWENFTKRSPKSNESIRSIRPDLASAVNDCIDAAGREWEPFWQKRLLTVRHSSLQEK